MNKSIPILILKWSNLLALSKVLNNFASALAKTDLYLDTKNNWLHWNIDKTKTNSIHIDVKTVKAALVNALGAYALELRTKAIDVIKFDQHKYWTGRGVPWKWDHEYVTNNNGITGPY